MSYIDEKQGGNGGQMSYIIEKQGGRSRGDKSGAGGNVLHSAGHL